MSVLVWIAGVDIPWALIEAQRDGRLVLFVGAGASRSSPSDLPDFRQLAARIAADSGVTVTDEQYENPDVLLGDLKDQRAVDVHQRVADLIGAPSSRPNQLHRAIAALAAAVPQVRIVTTNYDLHLSEELTATGRSFTEEVGPALPLGDDFTGVVYLHGRLGRPTSQLVVTDADFGQAYLRDAWAARFLERMFSQYVVLFIGYSHSDVVVSYLGRALRAESIRYVLTDVPDSPHWRRLRITPVAYPNPDRTHSALPEAIRAWASWASMGLLDHRQQVSRLVSSPPSYVPEEMSYLETVIADTSTVGFFTEYARGPEWLSWAAAQEGFLRLFDKSAGSSECSRMLASWFVENYVMEEGLSDIAWSLVSGAGGLLGYDLWEAIGRYLNAYRGARPGWLGRWLVLMIQNAPRSSVPWIEYALMESAWPGERALALLLFDFLTEPQAVIGQSFAMPSGARTDVELRGDQWSTGEAWSKVFVPHLADAAEDLIVIMDRQLRRAHALLTAAGAARPGWDPMCFSRSAIESHEQDSHKESADLLIDAARDCLERLLADNSSTGMAYLQSWADTDVPLLRRLAVHGWTRRNDVDASAKLTWLMDRGWLFDHQLRHEVFALIAATISQAPGPIADALVAEAKTGPAGSEHREYEAYNALAWIARHAPDLESARQAFDQAQASHPEYAERSHPDLMAWTEGGFVRPQPPMSIGELHGLIESDPADAISELRRITSRPERPGWEDALDLISDTVRDWPSDGLAILDTDGGTATDVLHAVIRGWSAAAASDIDAPTIVGKLASLDLSSVYRDVTRLLSGSHSSDSAPAEWHRVPAARALATGIWAIIDSTSTDPDGAGWLARAISDPAGQLAQFWVKAIASDWQAAGDTWSGLPGATRCQLETMLTCGDNRGAMTEIVFASQIHFFRAADPDWCLHHLLPLLDWTDPARARRAWDGYLTWGRIDDQLLTAGLLDQYVQAAVHISEFPEELRRQLYGHLAAIVLHRPDTATAIWACTLTAHVDHSVRVDWMTQVGWDLSTLPTDTVEQHWRKWMRTYWDDRLASIPTQLTRQEASAMATWIAYLTDSFEEAVTKATAAPAELTQHSRLLHELTSQQAARAPSPTAKLVTHLLHNTDPPFYRCDEIQRIGREIANADATLDLTSIREEALRLGCRDAPQW